MLLSVNVVQPGVFENCNDLCFEKLTFAQLEHLENWKESAGIFIQLNRLERTDCVVWFIVLISIKRWKPGHFHLQWTPYKWQIVPKAFCYIWAWESRQSGNSCNSGSVSSSLMIQIPDDSHLQWTPDKWQRAPNAFSWIFYQTEQFTVLMVRIADDSHKSDKAPHCSASNRMSQPICLLFSLLFAPVAVKSARCVFKLAFLKLCTIQTKISIFKFLRIQWSV